MGKDRSDRRPAGERETDITRGDGCSPVALVAGRRRLLIGIAAAGLLGACSIDQGQLTVFAASSLQPGLDEIHRRMADQSGLRAVASYSGSQTLAAQVKLGARPDIFISANLEPPGGEPSASGRQYQIIAANKVVAAATTGNPAGLKNAFDLARDGVRAALAGPAVPLGQATQATLAAMAGDRRSPPNLQALINANAISLDLSARAVQSRLLLGEADGGFVYSSSLVANPQLVSLEGTGPHARSVRYWAAALSPNPAAKSYLQFLTGPEARSVLTGFGLAQTW